MFARVMHIHILPGKLNDLLAAVDSLMPTLKKQAGFRAMMILRSAETPASHGNDRDISATSITLWDSMEHMRASEDNMFLYQALARLKEFCKGFPQIREEEVIVETLSASHHVARSDDTQS